MNIEEEGGGMFDKIKSVGSKIKSVGSKIKKATPNPVTGVKALYGKAKAARALSQAMGTGQGMFSKALKGKSKYGSISSNDSTGKQPLPILKLLTILVATGVLGAFAALAINKSQNFKDSILKWGILMLVMIIPVFIAYMKKSETLGLLLDTILESELNIICIYAILAFTSYSTLVKSPSLDTFQSMNPWEIAKIVIGLIIPLVIIGYTYFKVSPLDAIVIGVFAVAAAVILLSPQWISS